MPKRFAIALACLALPGAVSAADTHGRDATALRAEARAIRSAAEHAFKATEPGCHARFLVNACLDEAREVRLKEIMRARELEAEAGRIERAEREFARQARLADNPAPTPTPAASGAPIDPAIPTPRQDPGAPDPGQIPPPTQIAPALPAPAEKAEAARKASERAQAEDAARARATRAAEDRARYEQRQRDYAASQAEAQAKAAAKAPKNGNPPAKPAAGKEN